LSRGQIEFVVCGLHQDDGPRRATAFQTQYKMCALFSFPIEKRSLPLQSIQSTRFGITSAACFGDGANPSPAHILVASRGQKVRRSHAGTRRANILNVPKKKEKSDHIRRYCKQRAWRLIKVPL
jgi:hypothetical protein